MQLKHRATPIFGLAALTALGLAAAQPAQAQATQIASASGLAPGDVTLTYSVTPRDQVSSYTGSAGGNSVIFTDAGSNFREAQQGNNYHGGFATDTNLLETEDAASGNPTAPLTITFNQGVSEFGLTTENIFYGTDAFTFTPYSGTTALNSFSVTTDNSDGKGLSFLGAGVTGASSITSVVISSASDSGFNNQFAFGPLTFSSPAPAVAPEPSSVAAFAFMGLGAAALMLRARKRRAA